MRPPGFEATAVRLMLAVGKSAERASRTYCSAARARNLPMVICGLFLMAIASACRSVSGVPAPGDCAFGKGAGGGGACARARIAKRAMDRRKIGMERLTAWPPQLWFLSRHAR